MFASDQQDVAKAPFLERARLAQNFLDAQRYAQDRVVTRKAAIFAVVDALVREVEGREEPDHFAEALLRERLGPAAKRFQVTAGSGRNQLCEIGRCLARSGQNLANAFRCRGQRPFQQPVQRQRVKGGDETHGRTVSEAPGTARARSFDFARPFL